MFDLLLVDLRSKDLHEKISKKLQVEYLSESLHTELKEVNGIIFGPNLRIIVSLPVRIKQKTKNVHFVIDTGSPKTNSTQLINLSNIVKQQTPPIDSNFTDINVLGTEYLKATGSNLTINFTNENERVSIYFDNDKNEIISRLGQSISQVEPNVLGRIIGIVLLL
ncbi:5457_t:CDS:2 [Funneliformis caledonium]|uniref:5457_t:CDS:1 n=1 Tax=Funneliformis caledonium TaxID=1117310 RepID=A0A9N9H4D3_9GLOM|nr:5457_t:CDS:2 [Funneliformis caledonium]